jgi:CBS domain-containing protein
VWDAAAWISESGYRHLPVVDDEGALLGVVSVRDLLKALVETV